MAPKKNVVKTTWPVAAWVSEAAAHYIVMASNKAVQEKGSFSIALSGGSTPKQLFQLLAQAPFKNNIPWDKTIIAFGDERFVPATHKDSNFKMANDAILSKVPIPKKNILQIKTSKIKPEAAAREYEKELKKMVPAFDLVLLGMGEEGHTASIFPGSELLTDKKNNVAAVWVEEKKMYRISLTLSFINKANDVLFLVCGESKAPMVRQVFTDNNSRLPAAMVNAKGNVVWFLDEAANGR